MTPNERQAVIKLREYSRRDRSTITDADRYIIADAVNIVKLGIDNKMRAVMTTSIRILQITSGAPDPDIVKRLSKKQIIKAYNAFYRGDFTFLWDAVGMRGLEGLNVNTAGDFNANRAVLEMIVRMRAEEIMGRLSSELAEHGLSGELRALSNFKDVGSDPMFDRDMFGQRVKWHINEMISWGDRDILRVEGLVKNKKAKIKGKKLKVTERFPANKPGDELWGALESMTHKVEDPDDFLARTVAKDLLYKWGYKFGRGRWDFMEMPDGSMHLVPDMVKREIDDALDRAASIGGAWHGTEYNYSTSPRHNIGAAHGDAKATPWTKAKMGIGRVVDLMFDINPVARDNVSLGVTVGSAINVIPHPMYYGAMIVGNVVQDWMTNGAAAAAKDAAALVPTVGAVMVGRPDLVGAVMARMWKDGDWVPNARPIITPDFRVLTAEVVARLAEKHALKSSFIHAEAAQSLMKQIYEAAPPDLMGKAQKPLKSWQRTKIEMATFIDNYFRLKTFVRELDAGATPTAAAKRAKKAFFDYSELSDFERVVMRNIVMFYSYFRKSADLFWDTAITNPERVMGQLRLIAGSQRAAAEGEEQLLVFPEYHQNRFVTPTIKSWYNTHRYKGINYMAPYLPVPDIMLIITNLYDAMLGSGDTQQAAQRNLISRTLPTVQYPIVSTVGQDLFFGSNVNKSPNQVPSYLIMWDQVLTGGMLWDYFDIKHESPGKIKNLVYQEVAGRGIFKAQNGKNYWMWKQLNQVALGGRTMQVMWDLDRMNLGFIESINQGMMAYLEATDGGLLQKAGWLDRFRVPAGARGSNMGLMDRVMLPSDSDVGYPQIGTLPIPRGTPTDSPYFDTAWPRPGMASETGRTAVPAEYADYIGLHPDEAIERLRGRHAGDAVMQRQLDRVAALPDAHKQDVLFSIYGGQPEIDPTALSFRELPALIGWRPYFQPHQKVVVAERLERHLKALERHGYYSRSRAEKTEDR